MTRKTQPNFDGASAPFNTVVHSQFKRKQSFNDEELICDPEFYSFSCHSYGKSPGPYWVGLRRRQLAGIDLVGIESNPGPGHRRSKNSKNKSKISPTDQWIISSTPGAASAFQQRNVSDMALKTIGNTLTQRPPKNFQSDILWVSGTAQDTFTFLPSPGLQFAARSFALSDVFSFTALSARFDQYCIYEITGRICPSIPNSNSTPGFLSSVIDFDNAVTPTGFGQMEDYETFQVMPITQGCSQVRYIKPCLTPAAYNGVGSTGYTVGRAWVDSAYPGIPHYGLKYGVNQNTTNCPVTTFYTFVVGFRNKI